MSQKRRALLVGGGGTCVYLIAVLAIAALAGHFESDAGMGLAFFLFVPLLPGMIPGIFLSALLAYSVEGFGGVHELGFAVCSILPAPLVNSYMFYLWTKYKVAQGPPK